MGGQRDQPPARPGFDRRFGKSFTYLMPGGVEVDVHRTFVMGPFGLTIELDDLWRGGRPSRSLTGTSSP